MDPSYTDIEYFHKVAFTEKSNYIKFVYELGERNLRKIFVFPGQKFSLWWFSRVNEKSPFKSNAYERLISLLVSGNLKENGGSLKDRLKKSLLCQFFAGMYHLGSYCARAAYIRSSMRDFKGRANKLPSQDYFIVSYFPQVQEAEAEKGVFKNGYLSHFHNNMEERCPGRYTHILLQIDTERYDLKASLKLANKFAKNQSIFFLEEFFGFSDIFYLCRYYIYFSALFVINLNRIRRDVTYEYRGKSYDLWPIFKSDFYYSFCGPNLTASLWYTALFRKVIEKMKRDSKIISIFEMQLWEKVLYAQTKSRGLKTVGVQHTIVPELLLNYFNAPQEIKDKQFPLPDYLATVGEIPSSIFKDSGWPAERVFAWGAQRFDALREASKSVVSWGEKEDCFVCAFPMSVKETERILLLLEQASRKIAGYKILLKAHPLLQLTKVVKRMGLKLNPDVLEYTDFELSKIIGRSKGVITTQSSSSLYALAYDVPVIVPRFSDKIDCNPLSYISDIPFYVYSAEQLDSLCRRVIAFTESPCPRDKNKKFLKNYLYFPEDESEYFEKIVNLQPS